MFDRPSRGEGAGVTRRDPSKPWSRCGGGVGPALQYVKDPRPRNDGSVKNGKPRSIVLKSPTAGRSPDGDEILRGAEIRSSWHCQPHECDVTPVACVSKHHYRRNFTPPVGSFVRGVENAAKKLVAVSGSLVKRP